MSGGGSWLFDTAVTEQAQLRRPSAHGETASVLGARRGKERAAAGAQDIDCPEEQVQVAAAAQLLMDCVADIVDHHGLQARRSPEPGDVCCNPLSNLIMLL